MTHEVLAGRGRAARRECRDRMCPRMKYWQLHSPPLGKRYVELRTSTFYRELSFDIIAMM